MLQRFIITVCWIIILWLVHYTLVVCVILLVFVRWAVGMVHGRAAHWAVQVVYIPSQAPSWPHPQALSSPPEALDKPQVPCPICVGSRTMAAGCCWFVRSFVRTCRSAVVVDPFELTIRYELASGCDVWQAAHRFLRVVSVLVRDLAIGLFRRVRGRCAIWLLTSEDIPY
jgi:hypothetical protein